MSAQLLRFRVGEGGAVRLAQVLTLPEGRCVERDGCDLDVAFVEGQAPIVVAQYGREQAPVLLRGGATVTLRVKSTVPPPASVPVTTRKVATMRWRHLA